MKIHRRTISFPLSCLLLALLAQFAPAAGPYHGNVDSGIFHAPHCRWYNCKHCTEVFMSRQDALQAGYRPCKVCRP